MTDASQLSEEQRQELEKKLKSMSPEELRQLQKQQCIFCQIISGKIPGKKIYEDKSCLAVLDINPATRGHLLLLPKEHYAIMPQVPQKELEHLFSISKILSHLLLRALHVSGSNIFITNGPAAGQRAPHFLIHLLPRKEGDHLLPIKDKLIEPSLPEKVKNAVQERLLGLLGNSVSSPRREISKELSSEEDILQEKTIQQKKPRKKRSSTKKKEVSAGKTKKKEEEIEGEESRGGSAERSKNDTSNEDSDPTASLDEIAELFK